MGRKKAAKASKPEKDAPDLDCGVCIYRKECDRAEEISFCSRFRSKEFEPPEGVDPNDLWRRGEPVEF